MSKVGFPIRISTDRRLFAPPRSFSQRTTSFIASYRQGIHQMPLSHLIALISNAHPVLARQAPPWRRMELAAPHSAWTSIVERPEFIKIHPAPKPPVSGPSPSTPQRLTTCDALRRRDCSHPRHISSSRCQEIRVASRAETVVFFKHGCNELRSLIE